MIGKKNISIKRYIFHSNVKKKMGKKCHTLPYFQPVLQVYFVVHHHHPQNLKSKESSGSQSGTKINRILLPVLARERGSPNRGAGERGCQQLQLSSRMHLPHIIYQNIQGKDGGDFSDPIPLSSLSTHLLNCVRSRYVVNNAHHIGLYNKNTTNSTVNPA